MVHATVISRRLAILGAAALPAAATDMSPLGVDDVIRVIGRSDGGIAVRWTDGVLYARIDAATTPLFRVLSQIFSRHRKTAAGGFETVLIEIVYFADPVSGAVLESWRNPFTGETIAVAKTTLGPTRFTIEPSLVVTREAMPGGPAPDHRLEIERMDGDDIWITDRQSIVAPPMVAGAPPFGFFEAFTYRASRRDLADVTRAHVQTEVQKVNMLGARPWMQMGNRPGVTVTRGFGRVIDDPALLPADLQALNQAHNREVIGDLDDYLAWGGRRDNVPEAIGSAQSTLSSRARANRGRAKSMKARTFDANIRPCG